MNMDVQTARRRQQSLEALAKGNEIRLGRANFKKQIKSGEIGFKDAMEHEYAQAMTIGNLLQCQFRWGESRTDKLLRRRLSMGDRIEGRRVRDLTQRQKKLILRGLKDSNYWVL